jgi:hypothetical protein
VKLAEAVKSGQTRMERIKGGTTFEYVCLTGVLVALAVVACVVLRYGATARVRPRSIGRPPAGQQRRRTRRCNRTSGSSTSSQRPIAFVNSRSKLPTREVGRYRTAHLLLRFTFGWRRGTIRSARSHTCGEYLSDFFVVFPRLHALKSWSLRKNGVPSRLRPRGSHDCQAWAIVRCAQVRRLL